MMILNTSSNSRSWSWCKSLNRRIDRRGIARVLKLQIPELVYANLDEAFGRTEADEEIKIYCKGSRSQFVHFTFWAINFDPVVTVVDAKRPLKSYGWMLLSLM
jgi:hypothetical protein